MSPLAGRGEQEERVMHSRREFLQIGFAASMFPIAAPGGSSSLMVQGADAVTGNLRSFYRVIVDVRLPDGAAFGHEAERAGYEVVRITGDITDFWFNDLSLRWKEEAVAIAGLTAHGALFCLERFGWDYGLRVVARTELPGADESLVSWVIAPRPENR
jgi:hypothetical protein